MILNATMTMLLLSSTAKIQSNVTEPQPQLVNNSLIMEVIRTVEENMEYKNHVFFISERLMKDTDMVTVFFQQFSNTYPNSPNTIIVNNATTTMSGYLSSPTICFVLTTEHDDPIMELAAQSLKGVRYFKVIFILFPLVETEEIYNSFEGFTIFYDSIRLLYEWIWRKQFLRTILITVRNNIYLLDPYPVLNIINKTENWTAADFFRRYDMDFRGYLIQAPVYHDVPRVFRMTRQILGHGNSFISGISGRLFMEFVSSINATFNDTLDTKGDAQHMEVNTVVKMVEDHQLEIAVNSYTSMLSSLAGTSYPIEINDWCIIVPYRNRSSENLYLHKSFQNSTWLLICFTIFYVTFGIWFCTPRSEKDLSSSMLQSLCSLIYIPPLKVFTRSYLRIRFILVLLLAIGFCSTNLYLSRMASYLATSLSQQQINTVEDIIEADLPIMMVEYEYTALAAMNHSKRFLDLIIVSSKEAMDQHRDRFNTSFGYSTQSDRWVFLNKQQQYLSQPVFRLTSICMGPYYHVFPIHRDSHFAEPLQVFIMFANQFGFLQYWRSASFFDALFLDYVHMMLVNEEPMPLTLKFFRSIWYIWWFGLVLSGFLLICEIKNITLHSCWRGCGNFVQWLGREIYEL